MGTSAAPTPAIFFGHGNPMNAITENSWTSAWRAIGERSPKPKGVLAVSAHWYLEETAVTAMTRPRTIHDFGGFPRELFAVEYAAPGDPSLARRVAALLEPSPVRLDESWGLDHGTWSVLANVFPGMDVPVVQLSLDATKTPLEHYQLAKRLAPLRDEGILVIGSGNVVHNLHAYAWGRHPAQPFDWALRFEATVRELILSGRDALLSAPTPEHYLPLIYVLALRRESDRVAFPVIGIDGGSVSMLCMELLRRRFAKNVVLGIRKRRSRCVHRGLDCARPSFDRLRMTAKAQDDSEGSG